MLVTCARGRRPQPSHHKVDLRWGLEPPLPSRSSFLVLSSGALLHGLHSAMQVLHLQNERDAERNLAILGPAAVEVPPVGPALPPGVLVSSCSPHLPFVCVCVFLWKIEDI